MSNNTPQQPSAFMELVKLLKLVAAGACIYLLFCFFTNGLDGSSSGQRYNQLRRECQYGRGTPHAQASLKRHQDERNTALLFIGGLLGVGAFVAWRVINTSEDSAR